MKLAMVFPGQGSQAVGMLKAYGASPAVESVRAEAAQVLGADFLHLLDEGPAEQLNLTVNTQPAMLAAGVAAYRSWIALGGPEPEVVAGHSLGEYSALVAAGALTLAQALPLERLVVTVDHHGNTSAASVPLALDECVRSGRIRTGHRVLMEGVGGGFTWGAVLATM